MSVANLLMRNRCVLVGAGIVIAYVIFSILRANHFVSTLLRGDQYYSYYSMFIPTLFVFFCLYIVRPHSLNRLGWSLVFGIIAGYVAGLTSYIVVIFTMGDGLVRIANSVAHLNGFFIMLLAPFLCLSWIFGALVTLGVYLIKKYTDEANKNTIV